MCASSRWPARRPAADPPYLCGAPGLCARPRHWWAGPVPQPSPPLGGPGPRAGVPPPASESARVPAQCWDLAPAQQREGEVGTRGVRAVKEEETPGLLDKGRNSLSLQLFTQNAPVSLHTDPAVTLHGPPGRAPVDSCPNDRARLARARLAESAWVPVHTRPLRGRLSFLQRPLQRNRPSPH